ncbi:hypothetical protein OpiT1DRAFT_03351 [Opitutaceae bacterium TAV1]|nr:hypothetical protein OpiT1DRAFT_03351 [Opitutaceae bacterium TAV1]
MRSHSATICLLAIALFNVAAVTIPRLHAEAESSRATLPSGVEATFPQASRFVAINDNTLASSPYVLVKNTSDQEQTVVLETTLPAALTSTAKPDWPRVHQVTLAPGTEKTVLLFDAGHAANRLTFGIHKTRFRLSEPVRKASSPAKSSPWASDVFALYPQNPQPASGESVMPIGFATGAALATPRLLEIAASLGFEYYRFNAIWSEVQPREGVWKWDKLDAKLALLRQHNFRWHITTTGSPPWISPERFALPPPSPWRAWITALASRYKNDIRLWEIWNEPNISFSTGTVEQYGQIQRIARDAIKAVAPGIPVTSGGYAGINHGKNKPGAFESAFLAYPESYDWFAYHMHDAFPQFFNDLHIRLPEVARRARNDDVFPPVVFTETGFDTRFGQRFQAATLVKKITYAAAIGAKSYTWYNLMDRAGADTPNKAGQTFGLITNPTGTGNFANIENDIRPKESFVAAATAIRLLRHARPVKTWTQDGRLFAFLFALPQNRHLLVAWTEGDATPDFFQTVKNTASPQTPVEMLDLFGNASSLPPVDGQSLISYSAEPRYFLFHNSASSPVPTAAFVKTPEQIIPDANGVIDIPLRITNPLSQPLTLVSPETLDIPSGQTATLSLRRKITVGKFGETTCIEFPVTLKNLPWAPVLRLPVVFNTLDTTSASGQSFALDSLRHVVNKQDYDPYALHLLWSGPTDLSVKGRISVSPPPDSPSPVLRIELEVADNIHQPAALNASLPDGDALEIGWAPLSQTAAVTPESQIRRLEIAADLGHTPRLAGDARANRLVRKADIRRRPARNSWEGEHTLYTIELDMQAMRLTAADRKSGIRFNLAVHDNDGDGPKSRIALATGLTPDTWPILRLR